MKWRINEENVLRFAKAIDVQYPHLFDDRAFARLSCTCKKKSNIQLMQLNESQTAKLHS